MKLPHIDDASVEREKIVNYLLNTEHRIGSAKAKFFAQFGFRIEQWEVFAIALREHARQNEVVRVRDAGFGPRFEIDGVIRSPDGRNPQVRTVWQIDVGNSKPRLITAYPVESSE